jgi:hypothetical protein
VLEWSCESSQRIVGTKRDLNQPSYGRWRNTTVDRVLEWSCESSQVVNALLARKEIQIYQTTNDGENTTVHIACQIGRVKVDITLLARQEIQINQATNDGTSPLFFACLLMYCQQRTMRLMLRVYHVCTL